MEHEIGSQTVIVRGRVDLDMDVRGLAAEAERVKLWAEQRVIISNEDLDAVTNDLSIIAKLKKAFAEKKDAYVKPLKAQLEQVTQAFASFMGPLDAADKVTREKVQAFRLEQAVKQDEARAIEQAKLDLARREAALNNGETTVDLSPVQAPPDVPRTVRTGFGTLGTMKVVKWEVQDFSLVPNEYKSIDATRVGKVVKAGGSIPGIRTWEEETVRITAR